MRWRWLLGLHAAQLAFLLWLAATQDFCCDAYYYLYMGQRLLQEGLVHQDDFAGYRSYFVPLVLGLLQLPPAPAMPASGQPLPFVLSVAFTAVSLATSRFVLRREAAARYLAFAVPTLFNPFLLGHVPFPLQESVVMLVLVPLLVILLAVRERRPEATFGLVVLAGTLAFVIRGSIFWVAIPLALFLVLEIRRERARWSAASKPALAALAVAIPLALVAPQSYVMQKKFGTLNPYPEREVLTAQVFFGIEMLKNATIVQDGKWKQLRSLSPYTHLPLHKKTTLDFYRENLGPAAFLVGAHVWAGLHYDVLTTYVRFEQLRILSPWIVLSAFVVAWGLLGLVRYAREPEHRARAVLLAAMFLLSCLYTAFVGVEARFGLFGFLALSVGAAQLAATREGRSLMLASLPLAIAYAALCLVFNATLLYASPEI